MLEVVQFLDKHSGAIMSVITLVYVIATITICVANLRSAKATRDQVKESKRQYEENNRAFVAYSFIYERRTWYGMRFTNIGKRFASDVSINFEESFTNSLIDSRFCNNLRLMKDKTFTLGCGQSYDIFFGANDFRDRIEKKPIQGTLRYKDGLNTYEESFFINFANYPPIFSVDSNEGFEKIGKELVKQTSKIAEEIKKTRIIQSSETKTE